MAKALTDIQIRNLKPRAVRYEVPDPGARGLRVVVQPSGRTSYAVRFRNAAGRARKLTLPAGITLAAARKLAADALLDVAQGNDPAAGKQTARKAGRARGDDTVTRWADTFIERHVRRNTRHNSARATIGIFRNIILPAWGERSVHDIARRDVIDLVEGVAVDRPVQANRTHAVVAKFFKWLCQRDVITASPCTGVDRPTKEMPCERVLDDDELRRLWAACGQLDLFATACVRLLILTGLRRAEIAGLRWDEVGDDELELPVERMKGRRSHVVPLSSQARAIIDSVPRQGDRVFGHLLGRVDAMKRKLDRHMGDTPHWTLHDIRRTVASDMAKIGIALPVIEKIMAHRKGSFAGIVSVYQKYSFAPEMADALQRWADHVEQLVTGKSAKVVKLRRR
jgi:integrase